LQYDCAKKTQNMQKKLILRQKKHKISKKNEKKAFFDLTI